MRPNDVAKLYTPPAAPDEATVTLTLADLKVIEDALLQARLFIRSLNGRGTPEIWNDSYNAAKAIAAALCEVNTVKSNVHG